MLRMVWCPYNMLACPTQYEIIFRTAVISHSMQHWLRHINSLTCRQLVGCGEKDGLRDVFIGNTF